MISEPISLDFAAASIAYEHRYHCHMLACLLQDFCDQNQGIRFQYHVVSFYEKIQHGPDDVLPRRISIQLQMITVADWSKFSKWCYLNHGVKLVARKKMYTKTGWVPTIIDVLVNQDNDLLVMSKLRCSEF